MKLVVMSLCAPEDVFLISHLIEAYTTTTIVRIVPSDARAGESPRELLKSPMRAPLRLIRSSYYKHLERRHERVVTERLYGSAVPDLQVDHEIRADKVNSMSTRDLLQRLAPDFLILSGAPILKERIFSIPRRGTLNLHHGIVPDYRGGHTLWWPLYRGDYDKIGVTLHYVNSKTDAGNIIARGYPGLDSDDDEATLSAKVARLGTELLLEFLSEAEKRPILGAPQDHPGKLFRYQDRRLPLDAKYLLKRHLLGERPPSMAARMERFY